MNQYKFLKTAIKSLLFLGIFACISNTATAQEAAKEEDFFRIQRVSAPEGTILEVGGLTLLPNGDLAVSTRRGDVFIVENPTSTSPFFRKFASGLHEVLGLAYKNGALYCVQRGELTKMVDTNMDGKADVFETVYAWPITGNYHEYSFGPKIAPDGSFFVTLNLGFFDEWWHPESKVPYRGWALKISEDGSMEPWAAGLRSPAGISMIDGELYYTDNQGDWVASGSIRKIKKGAFYGHPASLDWTSIPNSPLHVKKEQLYSKINPRKEYDNEGKAVMPKNIVNEKFTTMYEMKKEIPELELPAVWLPHGIFGISNSEIVKIPKGVFGPFEGQLLVGDQGQSKLSRVILETVNGEEQGAVIDFRNGFQSGVVRLAWGKDGSLFAGETSRGWGAAGEAVYGLQRLVWNNRLPFEMRTIKAMPDGFEIEFTKPADKKTAEDVSSYTVESFIYKYHAVYGSPPVDNKNHVIKGVKVSDDGMKARIIVDGLRPHYVHKISLVGVHDKENSYTLVHPDAYYTLNQIPAGQKLTLNEVSTKNSSVKSKSAPAKTSEKSAVADNKKAAGATKAVAVNKPPTFEEVKPLLTKYTCLSCHNPVKKQVGPAFAEVAKRRYSIDKIVSLIYSPQPQNWPDYAVAMPPMPQVPKADARKIAAYINSLK